MTKTTTRKKKTKYPVRGVDRKRLHEIKEVLGSWPAVSEALGFRGPYTARRWVLAKDANFKGHIYADRIKKLHEKLVVETKSERGDLSTAERVAHLERLLNVMTAQLFDIANLLPTEDGSRQVAKAS